MKSVEDYLYTRDMARMYFCNYIHGNPCIFNDMLSQVGFKALTHSFSIDTLGLFPKSSCCAWPIKPDLGVVRSASPYQRRLGHGSRVIWQTWVPCCWVNCVPFFCVLYPVGRKVSPFKCSIASGLLGEEEGERLRTLSLQVGMQPPGSRVTSNIKLGY